MNLTQLDRPQREDNEAYLQEPEMRMLLAMIHRAILDYHGDFYVCDDPRKAASEKRTVKISARYWLNDDSEDPWSFLWVLAHFVEDPRSAQAKILRSLDNGELKQNADDWFAAMQEKQVRRIARKGEIAQQLSMF